MSARDGSFGAGADLTGTDRSSIRITVTFDGDDLYEPSAASLVLPVGQPSQGRDIGWLPWAIAPLLIAAAAAGGFVLGRRFLTLQRLSAQVAETPGSLSTTAHTGHRTENGTVVPDSRIAQSSIRLNLVKPVADLPAVWGRGEAVDITIELTSDDGGPIAEEAVTLSVNEQPAAKLRTNQDGAGTANFVPDLPGIHQARVRFEGDDRYSSAEATDEFRVVVFREEVIALFNSVGAWSSKRIRSYSKDLTPRELEATLLTSGLDIDERSLAELVRLFEYADYSEHEIARPHYESMYRSCKAVMGDDLH